jgi:hypothetical protein
MRVGCTRRQPDIVYMMDKRYSYTSVDPGRSGRQSPSLRDHVHDRNEGERLRRITALSAND